MKNKTVGCPFNWYPTVFYLITMMKHFLFYLFFVALLFSCASPSTKHRGLSKATTAPYTMNDTLNNLRFDGDKTNALGPIRWGVTRDGHQNILESWFHDITVNQVPTLCGLKIDVNEIESQFDADDHLSAISIPFRKLTINTTNDFSKEEKKQIEQIFIKQNRKIRLLMDAITHGYGESPTIDDFDIEDTDIYFSETDQVLAEWRHIDTHAVLRFVNTLPTNAAGCQSRVILELEKQ